MVMIQRSTLVLLTCMATWTASAGTALSTEKNAVAKNALPTATQPILLAQAVDASSESSELDINSRGEAVSALQRRLREADYYDGPIDGIYGLATERAVRALQSDLGLEETGSLTEETWQRLQSVTASTGENATRSEGTTVADESLQPDVPETVPTASELPAEGDADAVVVSESDSGLGRTFGLGLGLAAVLASFGIGFFLANREKTSLDEGDGWGESASSNNVNAQFAQGERASNLNSELHSVAYPNQGDGQNAASADAGLPSNSFANTGNNTYAMEPRAGQLTSGQMGGTSPLTPVDIVDGLIGDLRNPDPARRRKAIWELGQRGNSVAMKPLVDAMVDADSKEKSLVLAALSEIGIRSLKPMSKALAIALQDDNPEVRKNAIRDLTRVYDLVVQISQMLGHATEDEDPEVRQTAAWALEQLSRIRRSQDLDANVRSFSGSSSSTAPIDLLSSEASLRRSQQGM